MTFKEDLKTAILDKRPKLTQGSVNTYISVLNSLYTKLRGDDGIDFFRKEKADILRHIKGMEKAQTRKTILSALYILTEDEQYKTDMMNDIKMVNDYYKLQKTDADRQSKLKSFDEIKAIYAALKATYAKDPTQENMMNVLIAALMSGVLIPPRRLQDYTEMKVNNVDKEHDNYIDKNDLVFSTYKTAKNYGTQRVEMPKELKMLISKWAKQNESEYLLTNKGRKFSASTLSKRLTKLFGCSVDMLRSIYLSNLYDIKKMEKVAEDMGHSVQAQMNYYVKKDA
jgi:hypothetical protein